LDGKSALRMTSIVAALSLSSSTWPNTIHSVQAFVMATISRSREADNLDGPCSGLRATDEILGRLGFVGCCVDEALKKFCYSIFHSMKRADLDVK
jgi:hypothetical protein